MIQNLLGNTTFDKAEFEKQAREQKILSKIKFNKFENLKDFAYLF